MNKPSRRQRGQAIVEQPDLFDRPAGIWFGFTSDHEFRIGIGDAIAVSGLSRAEVASRMERLLGNNPDYPISEATVNSWCAPARTEWRMPAIYLLAFIEVVGMPALLRRAAHAIGLNTYGPDDQIAAEYGKKMAMRRQLDQELRQLETKLRGR